MRLRLLAICFLLLLASVSWLVPGKVRSSAPQNTNSGGPYFGQAVNFGVSPPVRSLKSPAAPSVEKDADDHDNEEINERNREEIRKEVPGVKSSGDGALQTSVAGPKLINTLTAPLVTFDALSNQDNATAFGFRVSPPDTNMDVGPNHIVQTVNLLVRVFNKSGVPLTAPFKMSSLFSALGNGCATRDNGDPIVLYDPLADRWLLSQFCTLASPNTHQLIAISQTSDPTGSYFIYDFMMPNNRFNDYPHLGVWPDGYYMTDNQFVGNTFAGGGAFAFDRKKMLVGDPKAGFIYFDLRFAFPNQGLGGMLPSDLDGLTPPPAGRPNTFGFFTATEFGNPSDGTRLFDFHADFSTPALSTFTERGDSGIAVAPFNPLTPAGRTDIQQPPPSNPTTHALDSIADRLMHRLQYRNFGTHESLVVAHTVNVTGSTVIGAFRAGVRHYEFRRTLPLGSFAVNEQGTFAPSTDTASRWMGSAAMDGLGDLAVGYSVSSISTFPSIRYAARLASDPPNGLFQGEQTLIAGTGVQRSTGSRWGDYSSLSVDPADDCTFWYTTEYYTAASQATSTVGWLTRIGSFKVDTSCTPPPFGTLQGTVTNAVTGLPITNALVETSNGYARNTSGTGAYSMTPLAPDTYTVTASAVGYQSATASGVIVSAGGTTTRNFSLTPVPDLDFVSVAVSGGNGNGTIDSNECDQLSIAIRNIGAANASSVSAVLSSATPGVSITQPNSPYPNMAPGTGGANTVPFSVSTAPSFLCGTTINFTLTVNFTGGSDVVQFGVASCNCPPTTVTGSITATDSQQTFRMTRDGLTSLCDAPKGACPGLFATTGTRSFDQYSFTNTGTLPVCVAANLNSACGTNIFGATYLGSFNPANVCANYLADAGGSFAGLSTWSFTVPGGATFVIVVHEVNQGTGCSSYTLSVNGLPCSNDGGGQCVACSISCPANLTVSNDPNQCGAIVNYSAPTTTGSCGVATCTPAAGSFFPRGTTTVTCSTTAGPSCSFTVTVNDTQPPAVTCPADLVAVTPQNVCTTTSCAIVTYSATATDNCPGVTLVCTPPSGSCLPPGVTTVTCTATDASSNTSSCSFTVTVFDVCMQDDSSASTGLLFNSFTGQYQFCCGTVVVKGTGSVSRTGCIISLTDNSSLRRVTARVDLTVFRGTATFQMPPGTTRCTITDRDTRNNTCLCR